MQIKSQLKPMTPYEMYMQQVAGTYDALRYAAIGVSYIPPQFGGLEGQRVVSNDGAVLDLVTFSTGA